MKAFISCSVSDKNEFLISLLAIRLSERNFFSSTSPNFNKNSLDFTTMNEINHSHLFIGIITDNGNQVDKVLEEWKYAVSKNIPNLLLIEDTIKIPANFKGNYILFNRNKPHFAIEKINKQISNSSAATNSVDTVSWILGGIALIGLLSYFSNKQ